MVAYWLWIGDEHPVGLREDILAARDAARAAGDTIDSLTIRPSYRTAPEAQISQKDYDDALTVLTTLLPSINSLDMPLCAETRQFPSSFRNLRRIVLSGTSNGLMQPQSTIPPLPPCVEYLHLKNLHLEGFSSTCRHLKALLLSFVTLPASADFARCLRSTAAIEILGLNCVRGSPSPNTMGMLPAAVKHVYSNASASQEALAALPVTVSSLTYVEPAHLLTSRSQLSDLSYACLQKGIRFSRKEEGWRRGPRYPMEGWAEDKLKSPNASSPV
ncbi:Protein DA1-related 4 [Rhodotorula toruloides ATCC 204091]|uniref:Protein DA1-related 4 n=1 Tax=Rhodotorula toruloides TaxID=5286 RepID=A0A0K3CQV2_RHOTO|nr:Protein DA1-related 4 [Rhodotorula toruloides ATCC 204091]PRQ70870.1 protein DA1-related 4 [Rhodotorula toruloides]